MAKPNPLQEQLLKAGLVKKSKVAEVAREQVRARHGKGPVEPGEIQREAERVRAEKAERDRALEAARKAEARISELRAQARQIIRDKKVPRAGDKVRERDPALVVLDHGQAAGAAPDAASSDDDAYYAQFKVPDDLVW